MERLPILKLEDVAVSKEKMLQEGHGLFKVFGSETRRTENEIVIENDLVKSHLVYEDLGFSVGIIPQSEEEFIGTELNANERALIRFLDFHPEDYFLLKDYRIENKSNGLTLDLSEELGENTVYVRKGGNEVSESASHYLNTYIKLNIEPKSVAGILTMFHEIGHKKDPSIDPLEIMLVSLGKEKDDSVAQKEMIDRERYAWAYSLNKLRPFLNELHVTPQEIDLFVHKWALGSYSASIDPTVLEKETEGVFSKIKKYFRK